MAEFLGKAFLSFLLILGAVEAVRLVVFALLRTRKKGKVCFLLTFHGHEEEAEMAPARRRPTAEMDGRPGGKAGALPRLRHGRGDTPHL